MRVLVDSHVALWWLEDNNRLGKKCKSTLLDSQLYFSVITPWELGIKKALGKLDYPDGIVQALKNSGFQILEIRDTHAELAPTLELHHKDPFDRMMIAQAKIEGLKIATADKQFDSYKIQTIDASK